MGVGWRRSALACAALATWSCDDARSTVPAGVDAAVLDDGRPASGDDGAEGCVLDGYACGDAGECCSGACTGGLCGLGGACVLVGGSCTTPDECCSRVCAGSLCAGDANGASLPNCLADDAPCGIGTVCCGGACTGGHCHSCTYSLGTTACDACISETCCATFSVCLVEPACASMLACVVACERAGGSGSACALQSCAVDADALSAAMSACYATSCTAACSGS